MRDFETRLPDGRAVEIASHGDESGFPVFAFHGTPFSNGYWGVVDEVARRRGVHVLAPDRPGIGGSDPHPLRFVATYAEDVSAMADGLDLARIAVVGHSGGGPFALACGAIMPERVTAVATLAGVAPLDTPGVEERLGPGDRRVLHLLWEGKEGPARRRIRMLGAAARYLPWLAVAGMKRSASDYEQEVLQQWGRPLVDALGEAFDQGPAAAVNEYRLFSTSENWGFEPGDISVPVHVWQGEDDQNTDPIHALALAELMPQAELHLLSGVGHPVMATHFNEVLDSLGIPSGVDRGGD